MNKPLRRVTVAIMLLFLVLLVNLNYVQGFEADSLKGKPGNSRVLIEQYKRDRGPIVVDGRAIAKSKPTNGTYKYQRTYTNGPLYAPATGYYSIYQATGIEKAENGMLDGTSGKLFVRRMMDLFTGKRPRGASVVLTLNKKAQQAAYQGLRNAGSGAAVALDPKTGKILALASNPNYDPERYATHDADKLNAYDKQQRKDPKQPLLNRALNQTYPPGSTFKLVTSAAALDNGYEPSNRVPAPTAYKLPNSTKYLHNDSGETCGDGKTDTLSDALAMSCNTAFAQLGVKLGAHTLQSEAEKFGLNDANLTVPLPVSTSVFPKGIDKAQTALSAMGQYDVRMTPLQGAMIAAGIANGGTVMKPYLVDKVNRPDLSSTIEKTQPQEYGTAMDSSAADKLTKMMVGVTEAGDGTANRSNIRIPGVHVAAKTGTAQTAQGQAPDAWFVAFAPANDPKVAVAVVVEHGGKAGDDGYGATVAGPIASNMMKAVLGK